MAVEASLVAKLRQMTGAPMLDCKQALEQTQGNIDQAIEEMRKSGKMKAMKKADRVAAEGRIFVAQDPNHQSALLIEINSETDFVGRDANFIEFGQHVAQLAFKAKVSDIAQITELNYSAEAGTIEQFRQALVAKIGENIQLRRARYISTHGLLGVYVHSNRIGVVVELENTQDLELAKDIAMHIAACQPQYLSAQDIPAELVAKEREIVSAQEQASGRPAEVIQRIVDNKIQKYVNEISLLEQPFVKDSDITVKQLLQQKQANVKSFVRMVVGEGIEKEVKDFAEEVRQQMR